jgi:hypothetical protein
MTAPAQADNVVSHDVGQLLLQAMDLANAGNYDAALAKVNQAETVKSLPDDMAVIAQMRRFIEVKAGDAAPPPAPAPPATPQP